MLNRSTCLRIKRQTKDGVSFEFEIGSPLLLSVLIWVVVIVLLFRGFDPAALLRTLVLAIQPAATGTLLNGRSMCKAGHIMLCPNSRAPRFSRRSIGQRDP